MPSSRIVPALDELEDGHAGLGLGLELAPLSSSSHSSVAKKLSHMALPALTLEQEPKTRRRARISQQMAKGIVRASSSLI